MNLPIFLEKNGLFIAIIIGTLAFSACIWAYMGFLNDMQEISEDMGLSNTDNALIIAVKPEVLEQLTTYFKEGDKVGIVVPTETIKEISTNYQKKGLKGAEVPEDILKSIETKNN